MNSIYVNSPARSGEAISLKESMRMFSSIVDSKVNTKIKTKMLDFGFQETQQSLNIMEINLTHFQLIFHFNAP